MAETDASLIRAFAAGDRQALADLLAQALNKGAVIVAAVGNDGQDAETLPASMEGVIGDTAVDAASRRYGKANTGVWVDFAAPIVTAYAARLMAGGTGSASGLRRAMAATAADIGMAGADVEFGLGLVQAPDCR